MTTDFSSAVMQGMYKVLTEKKTITQNSSFTEHVLSDGIDIFR